MLTRASIHGQLIRPQRLDERLDHGRGGLAARGNHTDAPLEPVREWEGQHAFGQRMVRERRHDARAQSMCNHR